MKDEKRAETAFHFFYRQIWKSPDFFGGPKNMNFLHAILKVRSLLSRCLFLLSCLLVSFLAR